MKLTAAYYRSSTKLQEDSVETQRYNTHQYALKQGILIDVEYPEPYTSARKKSLKERPQMKQLMHDIKNHKIGQLIVYKRDRLARKVDEHLNLYYLLKKHDVDVHLVADNEPPMRFDVFGELTELFIGVMNQREGEQITSRIVDTKVNNFLKGNYVANLPYGYKTDDSKSSIIKVDEELKIVEVIFEEWNKKQYKNTRELADKLNREKRFRQGKKWASSNVQAVLTNPIYMGLRIAHFNGQPVSRSVMELAVISQEDFKLAQSIIDDKKTPRQKQKKFYYLLDGFIHCQKCQEDNAKKPEGKQKTTLKKHQRTKNGERYPTYECRTHKIILDAYEIEDHIHQKLRTFFFELLDTHFDDLYDKHLKSNLISIDTLKKQYQKNLTQAEDDLTKATTKWINKGTESTKRKCIKLSESVKVWKEKLHRLESKRYQFLQVPEWVHDIKQDLLTQSTWSQLDNEDKRALCEDLIHQVVVDVDAIQIVFKHPFLESNEVIL